MLPCFTTHSEQAIPIEVVSVQTYPLWLASQTKTAQTWLAGRAFRNEPGMRSLLPDSHGRVTSVIICVDENDVFWEIAGLALQLPEGIYTFTISDSEKINLHNYALAWGLGSYQFSKYKKFSRTPSKLQIDERTLGSVSPILEAVFLVRDLINTPTDDLGPSELAQVAQTLAEEYKAEFSEIVGDDLLNQNYASIHTVGRASNDAPRLIDIRWGNPKHPRVTLVGKGVCFDSGGLDIKSASGMLLMKKDMAGAAHVLGLAHMIISKKLPIQLRVLIPAVENVISGNA